MRELRLGGELELTRSVEHASADGEIRPRDDGTEVIDRNFSESQHRVESRIRLGEKVRMPVERAAAGVEDDPFGVDRGGIDVLFRVDVTDVVGADRQIR